MKLVERMPRVCKNQGKGWLLWRISNIKYILICSTFLVTTWFHMCYFIVLMSSLLFCNVENSKNEWVGVSKHLTGSVYIKNKIIISPAHSIKLLPSAFVLHYVGGCLGGRPEHVSLLPQLIRLANWNHRMLHNAPEISWALLIESEKRGHVCVFVNGGLYVCLSCVHLVNKHIYNSDRLSRIHTYTQNHDWLCYSLSVCVSLCLCLEGFPGSSYRALLFNKALDRE